MIPNNETDALSIFVDEAGDPKLFKGRRGKPLVGSPGCSRFFILGKLEVENPAALAHKLKELRTELLNDLYFAGVESFRPERKKTAHAFHAKDDLPEVRYRVFSLLCAEDSSLRFHTVVCDKNALLEREQAKREANFAYRYQPNALYDSLVRSLFSKFHRLADRYDLCVARRGHKDRNEALTLALEHAEPYRKGNRDVADADGGRAHRAALSTATPGPHGSTQQLSLRALSSAQGSSAGVSVWHSARAEPHRGL